MIGVIQYGSVILDVTRVNSATRKTILSDDGVDRLYVEHTINVDTILNPEATSYASLGGHDGQFPIPGNAFAARTDKVITDYLSVPRRPLKMYGIENNGQRVVYLESPPLSPSGNLPSDAKNGPIVLVNTIKEIFGAKTWLLNLTIQTWISGCYDKTTPIISNRWDRHVSIDENFRATSTTRGVAVFDVGRLWKAGQSPDDYRSVLFFPPPDNFSRVGINVTVSSDNTRAEYTVVDAENDKNLGVNSPATKLSLNVTNWMNQGSAGHAVAQSAPSLWQTGWSIASAGFRLDTWGAANAAMGSTTTIAGNMQRELPRYHAHAKCRAEGPRTSSRRDLANLAIALCFNAVGEPNFLNSASRQEIIIGQDRSTHQNVVEVDVSFDWEYATIVQTLGVVGPIGPIAATLGFFAGAALGNDAAGLNFFAKYFPENENREGNAAAGTTNFNLTKNPIGNKPVGTGTFLDDKNSRASGYLKHLVVQGLLGNQCAVPSDPRWDKDPPTTTTVARFNVPFLPSAD